ncbi:murein hydrolase activator EnvC family protein [Nitrospirillum amazonense]|uniref:Septal ring factor EnvC (AmiA/AmiB activator) n=1 Tax=Nitrospirillum amazonense TaxID=28077 RepID=A0A560JAU9_9PROT|nr:peptidoglycan DD-metalloendopeptidase family protein [Nitrospirillum amazonense]MDG3440883.1 peptidoglycan DD-metalloendopeptidase family protein [Nitrospirillum amazonense]TWB68065.1 septal ring factor EnvC (AmiA/AmiB activator) [Nitrospirillum amazonense]
MIPHKAPFRLFPLALALLAPGSVWAEHAPPVVLTPVAQTTASQGVPRDAQRQLDKVEKDLKADQARKAELDAKNDALERELADLRAKSVAVAEDQRRQDDALRAVEQSLAGLAANEQEQVARIDADRAALAELLGALQRLSRLPPEAMVARPEAPGEMVKSALLLREAIPQLKKRADALAVQLRDLAALRQKLADKRAQALAAKKDLEKREGELRDLVSRREALSQANDAELQDVAGHMAVLTAQAGDLRDLVEKLEAERKAAAERARQAEAQKRQLAEEARQKKAQERLAAMGRTPKDVPGGTALGGMTLPVAGPVAQRYGEQDAVGTTSRGVRISARAGSPVVAPYEGSVVFAGPFKGYGLILIVEHPNGYHSLIAGLGRIDTRVGQRVLTGEPMGAMASDGTPTLYFELRRGGQPINPLRGFAGTEGKGQG